MLLYEHTQLEEFADKFLQFFQIKFLKSEFFLLLTKNKHKEQGNKHKQNTSLSRFPYKKKKLILSNWSCWKKSSYKGSWIIVDNQFHTSSESMCYAIFFFKFPDVMLCET